MLDMADPSKDILRFDNLIEGSFIERPNRFLVIADVKGERIEAHLKDPGRLIDLMISGARMLFKPADGNTKRKTLFDVIAVMQHDGAWILVNSGYHNKMAQCVVERGFIHELIGYEVVHKEYAFGGSRIDFLLEKDNRQMLLEVKGSTFIRDDISYFPDAPTKRGVRHLDELISAKGEGWDAGVLFIVMQPEAREIQAYRDIDPVFAGRLKDAHDAGVVLCAAVFGLRDGVVSYLREIPVRV